MPMGYIIDKVNRLGMPPQLTTATGTTVLSTIDPVTGKRVEKVITTWCHSKTYFKLRGRDKHSTKDPVLSYEDEPNEVSSPMTKSDQTSATVRKVAADLSRFTEAERAVVMKLLGE